VVPMGSRAAPRYVANVWGRTSSREADWGVGIPVPLAVAIKIYLHHFKPGITFSASARSAIR
jgi:hypothetical protein